MLEHNQVPRRFCNFQYVWPHFFLEHFQLLISPCIQNVKAECFQPARRHSILCWASHHESPYFQAKTCSEADFFAFCLVSRVSGGARAFSAIQKSTWNDNKFQNLRRVSLKSQEVQREWGARAFFLRKHDFLANSNAVVLKVNMEWQKLDLPPNLRRGSLKKLS